MFRPMLALSVLLPMALAGCNEVPAGTSTREMKTPEFWGEFFLNKYADERQAAMDNLEPGPEPLAEQRTVLLVTGVTIPAEWLDSIKLRLERDGFRPVVYEPPNLLSGDLTQASVELGEVVERVRAESGQDRIDILAECTGGLIARHYVQSLGGDAYVERLVVFVSPQNGIKKAPLAAMIADWPALKDLSPGSDFLNSVQSVPLPDSVAMTSIYTCTDEYIQPYQTSIVEGATNIGLCDGFVGHFQTMYDPEIYLVMHGALTENLPGYSASDDSKDDSMQGDTEHAQDGAAGCSSAPSPWGAVPLLMVALFFVSSGRRRQRSAIN